MLVDVCSSRRCFRVCQDLKGLISYIYIDMFSFDITPELRELAENQGISNADDYDRSKSERDFDRYVGDLGELVFKQNDLVWNISMCLILPVSITWVWIVFFTSHIPSMLYK